MNTIEILKIAIIDTVLGMGTVFLILIFISACIWFLGKIGNRKGKNETPEKGSIKVNPNTIEHNENAYALTPQLVAVIATAAIIKYKTEHEENSDDDDYVVRNIRRAPWKHIQ